MFDLSGKHFTILTWCKEGIGIGEQYPNDTQMSFFRSAKDLVDGFTVNGVPLGELAFGIRITDYT